MFQESQEYQEFMEDKFQDTWNHSYSAWQNLWNYHAEMLFTCLFFSLKAEYPSFIEYSFNKQN